MKKCLSLSIGARLLLKTYNEFITCFHKSWIYEIWFFSMTFVIWFDFFHLDFHLMWLACQKKSYLICDEITNFEYSRNLFLIFFWSTKLRLTETAKTGQRQLLEKKVLHNISEIRNFVTYQITFPLTCHPHKRWNFGTFRTTFGFSPKKFDQGWNFHYDKNLKLRLSTTSIM